MGKLLKTRAEVALGCAAYSRLTFSSLALVSGTPYRPVHHGHGDPEHDHHEEDHDGQDEEDNQQLDECEAKGTLARFAEGPVP